MRARGLAYGGPIAADGKLHRFKAEGDHEKNSWYVLHADHPAAGSFGCWKRGFTEIWCERSAKSMSDAEWSGVRQRWQEADKERQRAETERHTKARKTAAWILSRSTPADRAHHYLIRKGVKIFSDLHEYRGALVVPLRDVDGILHSLQFVGADGTKRFLASGRITGCFFIVADKPDGPLVMVEGYATGASVHEATGFATICCMNCGNLKAVADALRDRWPDREIIVAADDDAWTPGNPGITKATESAKAIGGRLAVPVFADVTTKPTDFNDLHQLEGIDIVKAQIESAATPTESDEDIITRLANLPPLEYERCREVEAEKLKSRTSVLDKLVDAKRPKSETADGDIQGRTMNLPDVEPWPDSVNGADVMNEVADTYTRFVVLPDGAADALALWTAHTHCFEAFQCSPRLNVTSPERGCGKTTLRDVLAVLVPRPLLTENLSVAVLFRIIEAHKPTPLADECDAWLRDNEELRGLLNAGHRRGGQALRCEGEDNEVRAFTVFAPVVLCGIGSLPGTLHDRSIVIRLERAKPGELAARFDSRHTEHEQELCRKLARFCVDNTARLETCDPSLPSGVFNRLADNWRPLFAIAESIGGNWPQRAVSAFSKLTSREDTDAQGIGAMLLADVWQAFRSSGAVRMFSKSLVESLLQMTDRPWPEANRGKPITETWLARKLRLFTIAPKLIRVGDAVGRGYELADFQEAVDRYLPTPGDSGCYSVTTPANKGEGSHSEVLQPANGVTPTKSQNANDTNGCNTVTARKQGNGADWVELAPVDLL